MADILSISSSGLRAYQTALTTTSHNIANANTEGYNRQRAELDTREPRFNTRGGIGQGVDVTSVQRLVDNLVTGQIRLAQSDVNRLDTFDGLASRIDNLLVDPQSSLMPTVESFFASLNDVANDPSSNAPRVALLGEAENLQQRFNFLNEQLQTLNKEVDNRLQYAVTDINGLAEELASINETIFRFGKNGQVPNDLLDQRERLLKDLSGKIGVDVVEQNDGIMNIFIGSGQLLVSGSNALKLHVEVDKSQPDRLGVTVQSGGSNVNITSRLSGGELGGLLDFRSTLLDSAQNRLGRLAIAMADSFNQQHADGQDLNGRFGGMFFTAGSPTAEVSANSGNTGGGSISLAGVSGDALVSSSYLVTYSAGNYTVTRQSDNTIVAGGAASGPFSFDGITINTAGLPADGDAFYIQPGPPAAEVLAHADNNPASPVVSATINDVSKLTISDYQVSYDGAAFSVRRLSDNQVVANGAGPFDVDGLTIEPGTGVYSAGDSFMIRPTRHGAADFRLALSDPNTVAVASPIRTSTPQTNLGDATISGGEVLDVMDPNLKVPATVRFLDTDSFEVSYNDRVTGNLITETFSYPTDATFSVNGWQARISGSPRQGDTFTIQENTSAAMDNRNGLALAGLQQQSIMDGSKTNYEQAYNALATEVGTVTSQVRINRDAEQALLNSAIASRESLSGVNLDEEAANLIRFQQAYQAMTRVVQTSQTIFQSILDAV